MPLPPSVGRWSVKEGIVKGGVLTAGLGHFLGVMWEQYI